MSRRRPSPPARLLSLPSRHLAIEAHHCRGHRLIEGQVMFSRSWRAACCAALGSLIAGAGFAAAQGPVLEAPLSPSAPHAPAATADAPVARNAATVRGVGITVDEVEAQMKLCPSAQPDAPRRVRQMEALGLLIDNVLMRQ